MAEKSPVIVFLFRTLVGEFLLLGRGGFSFPGGEKFFPAWKKISARWRKKENEIWEMDY